VLGRNFLAEGDEPLGAKSGDEVIGVDTVTPTY
jgi:hypothetical protein